MTMGNVSERERLGFARSLRETAADQRVETASAVTLVAMWAALGEKTGLAGVALSGADLCEAMAGLVDPTCRVAEVGHAFLGADEGLVSVARLRCAACGAEFWAESPDEARHCPGCGARVVDE